MKNGGAEVLPGPIYVVIIPESHFCGAIRTINKIAEAGIPKQSKIQNE